MKEPSMTTRKTKPATRKQVLARAAELGCTTDDHEDEGTLYVDAPTGSRFVASQYHTTTIAYRNWRGQKIDGAYDLAMEDMADGIEPCPDPNCETCRDRRDEDAEAGAEEPAAGQDVQPPLTIRQANHIAAGRAHVFV